MIDMNKEAIFRDGWTLDGYPLNNYIKARVFDVISLGYYYGLKLDEFSYDSEMIYFGWRGTKKAITAWYTDYSVSMTNESDERRNAALEVIRSK